MKYIAIAAAAVFALPAYAQNPKPGSAATPNSSVQEFVRKAAITNMFEIDAAQVAQNKAKDPRYNDYAKMIITDHTNLGKDLKTQVAKVHGVQIPDSLDQSHQQELQKLKAESGAAFERDYRTGQIEGHQSAIELFQNFSKNGSNPDLKSLAQADLPVLKRHLQRAQDLPQPNGQVVGAAQSSTGAAPVAATGAGSNAGKMTTTGNNSQETGNAQQLVNEAVTVIKNMKSDSSSSKLLQEAKGLYIVPEFGRGAFVVGGRGGVGLLTVKTNGKWSDPAFYDMGGISLGVQAGGSGGAIVFALMRQKAVDAFKHNNAFSLNAGAGLSIVNYSANAQASWGKSDVVLWSNTSGAYAGVTISVTDISWDQSNNRTYYGNNVDLTKILDGNVTNAAAKPLLNELSG